MGRNRTSGQNSQEEKSVKISKKSDLAWGVLRKLGSLLLIFSILMIAWNWRLFFSISKPVIATVIPSIKVKVADEYGPTDNLVVYPRLAIKAPLTESAETSPLRNQDWSILKTNLRKGVSLAYENGDFNTATFAYVTGHSSDTVTNQYASIFAGLGQTKIGDKVSLVRNGQVSTYAVISSQIINPYDVENFKESHLHPDSKIQAIALVTCWPPLTTKNRLVVVAEKI